MNIFEDDQVAAVIGYAYATSVQDLETALIAYVMALGVMVLENTEPSKEIPQ